MTLQDDGSIVAAGQGVVSYPTSNTWVVVDMKQDWKVVFSD